MSQSTSEHKIIIAIDGPACSGKGTIARGVAAHFGFSHLDTGLLYRAVGLRTHALDPSMGNDDTAIHVAKSFDPEWLNDADLRSDACSAYASKVAVIQGVREALLDFQRNFAIYPPGNGAVLDGRDIGTVICPKAPIKLFISADIEIRAQRRFEELYQAYGEKIIFEDVLTALKARDARDMNRKDAPLKPAEDSVLLDTSKMSIKDAIAQAIHMTENALASDDKMFICI
ncbi:MAG: (d)CMP kinase [Pseudomonadota bacterium]